MIETRYALEMITLRSTSLFLILASVLILPSFLHAATAVKVVYRLNDQTIAMTTYSGGDGLKAERYWKLLAQEPWFAYEVTIKPPKGLMPCITPKGSITLDGISLTIAGVDVNAGTFHVALIPTTLSETTIGDAKVGDGMNIETDIMARTVVHYLQNYSSGGN